MKPTSPTVIAGDDPALSRPVLLVADDDPLTRWSLKHRLQEEGFTVLEAGSGEQAWNHFEHGVDLVLLDHRLPDGTGLELLRRMVAADADVPVIMLTAFSSVDQAVEVMQAGAYHYAGKPFELDQIALVVQRALDTTRLKRRLQALSAGGAADLDGLIGASEPMRRVKALVQKVAQSPSSTVLLTGESGTGKDLVARVVHQLSSRGEGPFLNITCSALPATLFESELFGHERGSFTDARERKKGLLEQSHTGTVFLDEISEMPPEMQAKLLRFLEDKTFRRVGGTVDIRADVRIIAATNLDLQQAVRDGRFREDLYYRLAVLTVNLPPLRERDGDLVLLIQHYVARFNREFNRRVEGVAPAAMNALVVYPWPGNVRELRNAIERAVLLADRPTLSKDAFSMISPPADHEALHDFQLPARGVDLVALERSLVEQALDRARGNRTLAASLLGMNRDQIRYRIEKFMLAKHRPVKAPRSISSD